MKRISRKKNLLFSFVLLLVLVIGIGYAYLTSNLSISGTTGIVGNSWDIHFENLNVKDGSVTAASPAAIQSNKVDITYSIRLERPKDYYEFTVDVKNDGTLPGKVSISSLAGITSEAAPVVDYTITYTNGRSVNIGDILNADSKKTIRVRVFYKDDIQASDLPSSNINLSLTYTLQYIQSDETEFNTNVLINQLKIGNPPCLRKYSGQVTDQPGQTVTASNVYFNKCADKRNIIFNNMCFQMIRTTETGGIKMIYNGDVVDGKCLSTRGNHIGIVGTTGSSAILNDSYLYGDSFTYDTTTNEFTLTDTTTATWSDSTYEDLIGKFTCKSISDTCTTIYQINGYNSNTRGYLSSYTIGDTNYAQIGTSSYNANYRSPAMVGYMFNKVYNSKERTISSPMKFGSTFTYTNGTYTLSGTVKELSTIDSSSITHAHYTCFNNTGTCTNISYIYYISSANGTSYYIQISDGKSITDAINEMLYDNNVNRYNSSIKGIIDAWYRQNMLSKTNMLEDTVYCNDRIITVLAGWNPDGGVPSVEMSFKNTSAKKELTCSNETDQFAVSNNKAKLTYPVALLQKEEILNIDTNSLMKTVANWWAFTPYYYYYDDAIVIIMLIDGSWYKSNVYSNGGLRPVVSLANGAVISSGDGSEITPWVIE